MRHDRRAGPHRFDGVPAKWQRVFVTANHIASGMAHPDAGGLPGGQRLGDLEDLQLRQLRHRGVRRADLPDGLRARLQGRHRLPGRLARLPGALDRQHREEGGRGRAKAGRPRRAPTSTSRHAAEQPAARPCEDGVARPTRDDGDLAARPKAEIARLRKLVHELESENLQRRQKRSRPELLRGATRRLQTPLGDALRHDHRGREGPALRGLHVARQGRRGHHGRRRGDGAPGLARPPFGIPIREVYRQLRGISSDRAIGLGANKVLSVPDAVGIALERYMAGQAGHPAGLLTTTWRASRRPGGRAGRRHPAEPADDARRDAGDPGRRLPRLRLAARVRRGVHEVPRLRLQRVRLTASSERGAASGGRGGFPIAALL
jgi:ribonucleoside-diphosphate reductase alpha chain